MVGKNCKIFFENYERKNLENPDLENPLKIHENPEKHPKKSIFSNLPAEDLICVDKPSGNLNFMFKDNVCRLLRRDLRE